VCCVGIHMPHASPMTPSPFKILFKLDRMIYESHKQKTVKTRLVLEKGNRKDNVLTTVMNLSHVVRYYRSVINRPDINFLLMKSSLSAQLGWSKGIVLSNTVLDLAIPLLEYPSSILASQAFVYTAAKLSLRSNPNFSWAPLVRYGNCRVLPPFLHDNPYQQQLYPALK